MKTKNKRDRVLLLIREFKKHVQIFQKKNNGNIYDLTQNNLAVLKKTGKGNCIALSKLFNSICKKRRVKFYSIILKNIAKPNDYKHQISFVYDFKKKFFWLQSNTIVKKLKSYNEILIYSSMIVGWKPSSVIPIKTSED